MLRKASALLTKASREVRGENRAPDTRLGSRGTVRTRAKRYRRNRTTLLTRRFPRDFIRNLFLALGRASTFRARQLLTRLSSPTASRSRPFRRQAAKATSEYAELYVPGVTSGKILPKRIKSMQKKALRFEDPPVPKKAAHKGWPRGYEFGTHRMTRKLRPSELFWAEREARVSENDHSSGLAW